MDQLAKEPGLVRRGNRWIYRRRVPEDLVQAFGGRREIKESLRTEVHSEAKARRNEVAVKWDRTFAERRRQLAPTIIASAIHNYVSEKSRSNEKQTRTASSANDHVLGEAHMYAQIYQNPEHELTRVAIASITKEIFSHLLPESRPGLSVVEQIDAEARIPDILSHLSKPDQSEIEELLRKAVLEIELRSLDVLRGLPEVAKHQEIFLAPGLAPLTLEKATADYLREHFTNKTVNLKREKSLRAEAEMMLHLLGRNVLVSRIDRKLCREFRDTIDRLPSNITKHFPNYEGMELKLLVLEAARKSLPKMKKATQSKYITMLKSVLAFALAEGHISANPAQDLKPLGKKTPPKQARDPFNAEDLKSIFHTEPYIPTSKRRDARYWAALVGLFAGMRQNEICQLDISDIRCSAEGIWYLDVNDEGPDKSVKNERSRRAIPIHSELIKLGFVAFASDERERRGTGKLFEEVRRTPDRNYGYLLSKWFNQTFLKHANAKTPKKNFHSLRHSFRDALRRARTPLDVIDQLGGWTSTGRAVTSENYGDGFPLSDLALEVEKISYPGLDLSHLCKPRV